MLMFIDFGEVFCIHTTFVKSIVGFFLTIFFQKFLDLNLDDIKGNIVKTAIDDNVRYSFRRCDIEVMHRLNRLKILFDNIEKANKSVVDDVYLGFTNPVV